MRIDFTPCWVLLPMGFLPLGAKNAQFPKTFCWYFKLSNFWCIKCDSPNKVNTGAAHFIQVCFIRNWGLQIRPVLKITLPSLMCYSARLTQNSHSSKELCLVFLFTILLFQIEQEVPAAYKEWLVPSSGYPNTWDKFQFTSHFLENQKANRAFGEKVPSWTKSPDPIFTPFILMCPDIFQRVTVGFFHWPSISRLSFQVVSTLRFILEPIIYSLSKHNTLFSHLIGFGPRLTNCQRNPAIMSADLTIESFQVLWELDGVYWMCTCVFFRFSCGS